MEEKRTRVESVTSSFTAVRDKHAALEKTLASAEELLQTLLTGLSSNNDGNTGGGYLGQIADARGRASEARAEEEQANVKLQMSEKELKALQERWKAVEREANDGARKLEGPISLRLMPHNSFRFSLLRYLLFILNEASEGAV